MNEPCFVCEAPARSMLLVEAVVGVRRVPMCVDCYDSVLPEGKGLRTTEEILEARNARLALQERSG